MNKIKILNIVGRLLYGLPMATFGVFHFLNANSMIGAVPAYLPAPIFWVYFTGAALLLAGLSIVIHKFDQLATFLLGLMLLIFVLTIHLPGLFNAETADFALRNLLQTSTMAGAAFYMSASLLSSQK